MEKQVSTEEEESRCETKLKYAGWKNSPSSFDHQDYVITLRKDVTHEAIERDVLLIARRDFFGFLWDRRLISLREPLKCFLLAVKLRIRSSEDPKESRKLSGWVRLCGESSLHKAVLHADGGEKWREILAAKALGKSGFIH